MKRKIFLILLVLIIISVYKAIMSDTIVPNESIRLRVIPNSNDPQDINIKEKVKDYLEEDLYKTLKDTDNIEIARIAINNNLSNIEKNIDDIFTSNNYIYPYKVNYGLNYFPNKTYKGKTYKEGYYESLVISIGDAKGDNWWCVLFPNFCLIDNTKNKTYKSFLKELISKYSK